MISNLNGEENLTVVYCNCCTSHFKTSNELKNS